MPGLLEALAGVTEIAVGTHIGYARADQIVGVVEKDGTPLAEQPSIEQPRGLVADGVELRFLHKLDDQTEIDELTGGFETAAEDAADLAGDASHLFWAAGGNAPGLYQTPKGQNMPALRLTFRGARAVALNGTYVYVASSTQIVAMNKNTGTPLTPIMPNAVGEMVASDSWLYYTTGNTIRRTATSLGSPGSVLISANGSISQIAVDAESARLCWSYDDGNGSQGVRCGTESALPATDVDIPTSGEAIDVAVDGTGVYWAAASGIWCESLP